MITYADDGMSPHITTSRSLAHALNIPSELLRVHLSGRDYTFCEQFASVVTPKNISIRKSSLQQAHLIFRRLLIDFG